MEFSDQVLTKGKAGKLELRTLESRGTYVMCKYLDPKSLKPADNKLKLSLKDQDGTIREYFIIPLKTSSRSLLVKAEPEPKDRKIWNEKTKNEEEYWISD